MTAGWRPNPKTAGTLIRRHEDRQAESGEMVQRLIDTDQGPEPRMFQVHAERRGAKSLGAVDRDVKGKIDKCHEPEPRRDYEDHRQRLRQMHETMRQQRQRPSGLL